MERIADIICETLWPTRCAVCDKPGDVLCEDCRARLAFVDRWRACPTCGAPWGLIQCDNCSAAAISGQDTPSPCISALRLGQAESTIIRTFKDKGEQRLARDLAGFLFDALPPLWLTWANMLTFIPATKEARRRRDFDHMELVARELSKRCNIPMRQLLAEPRSKDQRSLGRKGRQQNMEGRFTARERCDGLRVLLIDDVFTTGATLTDAKRALEEAGAEVRLATVARA